MKYFVNDDNGVQVAKYGNKSELETYLKASYGDEINHNIDPDTAGVYEVKDKEGKTLARISVAD